MLETEDPDIREEVNLVQFYIFNFNKFFYTF